jgi:hypothetical protein
MPKEPTRTPEEEGKCIGHLLLFILAGAGLLRTEVLEKVEIDRDEIVNIATTSKSM